MMMRLPRALRSTVAALLIALPISAFAETPECNIRRAKAIQFNGYHPR